MASVCAWWPPSQTVVSPNHTVGKTHPGKDSGIGPGDRRHADLPHVAIVLGEKRAPPTHGVRWWTNTQDTHGGENFLK